MDLITRKEINDLLEHQDGICISLFMPLEREPDKQDTNRIRLKNLIKRGEERMSAENFMPSEMDELEVKQAFEPVKDLFSNLRIDVEQGRGLAVFVGPDYERTYRLPIAVEETVVIGPRFYIKPLLPLLNENNRFYLLTLSQAAVQLWQGREFQLERVEVPSLPKGMADALALEDPERELQFHTSTGRKVAGSTTMREAAFHGQEANEEKKGAILRYFREVDKAIMTGLADEDAPLLIASVDYLLPIYKEANSYPHLIEEPIAGNPEHLNEGELLQKAWGAVKPRLEETRQAAAERFRQGSNTDKTSQELEEIVPAAAYGRVDTLFISTENGRHRWGRFDEASGEIKTCQEAAFRCSDMLDFAAATTIKNGGTVYTMSPSEMPAPAEIAAIFRYSLE